LHLVTYFTVGPKEARAWTITKKAPARPPPAASSIRISKRASSAPKPSPTPITSPATANPAREKPARFRLEGKEYVVADGDVLHFRFAN
jgi:ribosome-binding ATPase YchF (GTP1/OBG family)